MTVSESVERFLASGEHDPRFRSWEGSAAERRQRGDAQLRRILQRIVGWRAQHAPLPPQDPPDDATAQVRARVTPMLRGMFCADEADLLVAALPQHVTVVTVAGFPDLAARLPLALLWRLANLLLDDMGAPPLADDLPQLEGFCEDGRAWVLPRAFDQDSTRDGVPVVSDTIVHEVAHLLHEVRRDQVGLAPGRRRILSIAPAGRETFAWTCEIWACIARQPDAAVDRVTALLSQAHLVDPRVDHTRLHATLLRAAAEPQRAWAHIRDLTGSRAGSRARRRRASA